jgi:HD-GYP domain-containing protein (c-di-GMP phosphodiesterase class II)
MKNDILQKDSSILELLAEKARECDQFEGYAHPHAARVAAIAEELAKRFNMGREDRVSLRQASLAHDLGELFMARDYIQSRHSLSDDELLDMTRHPLFGEQEAARFGADRGAQLLVRWHHEWWNGSGYPDALCREQIPLAARILRVADAFASLTDDRPFRKALTVEEARFHLKDWAGLEFDPHIVTALFRLNEPSILTSYAVEATANEAEDKLATASEDKA